MQTKQEKKPNRTEIARAVLQATGQSPTERSMENTEKVVKWVYEWGFTSSAIIQQLLRRTSGGYSQILVKRKVLVETKTACLYFVKSYFTLSSDGHRLATKRATRLVTYNLLDQYKVHQPNLYHDLLTQQLTLNALQAGTILSYLPERSAPPTGEGVKRPDVAWRFKQDGALAGIEVELEPKYERKLDQFVREVWEALVPVDPNCAPLYDRFIIFSESPAILQRYKEAFQPNAVVPLWSKGQDGKWRSTEFRRLPAAVISKIVFMLIP